LKYPPLLFVHRGLRFVIAQDVKELLNAIGSKAYSKAKSNEAKWLSEDEFLNDFDESL